MKEVRGRAEARQGPVTEAETHAEVCSCGAIAHDHLWGCRFCGGLCCPRCTYAPEGVAVCFRCAWDIFGVHVPWVPGAAAEIPAFGRRIRGLHTTAPVGGRRSKTPRDMAAM